jgi:flagellar hook-length control protein FliK
MHPLLSQPSNQSLSTGKSSIAKDLNQSARLESTQNDRHRDDTTASFSRFFESDEPAKSSDQTLDVFPVETATNDDQPPETNVATMSDVEPTAPQKRDILDGDATDQTSIETENVGLNFETSKGAQAVNNASPTEITKPTAAERPVVPHHFGWTGKSDTTTRFTNVIEVDQRALATVLERTTTHNASVLASSGITNQNTAAPDLTKAAAHPLLGLTASGTAPKSPAGGETGQQSVPPVQMMQPPGTARRAERKAEHVPTLGHPATPSPNRTQTALQNSPLAAGVMQQATDQAQTLKTLSSEPLALFTVDTTITPSAQYGAAQPRADLATHIARQLVEVAQHLPSRPVDITLSPDELGRVRLSVIPSENGIVVNVLAERPETLDLMRRHIDQLAQEFQSLGYDDISFSFSGAETDTSGENDTQSGENQTQQTSRDPNNDIMENTRIHLSIGATTGLDLRL